jgi:hypothetical protein
LAVARYRRLRIIWHGESELNDEEDETTLLIRQEDNSIDTVSERLPHLHGSSNER